MAIHAFGIPIEVARFTFLFSIMMRVFCFIPLLLFHMDVYAQQRSISGSILDEDRSPLPGATILIKHSTRGTITNASGTFNMIADQGDTLIITYLGYQTQEIIISQDIDYHILMTPSIFKLGELVITTGYSTQKVKEITGSVAIVKPNDLTAVPAGQVEQMLQGRVAGLNVITSGMPGGNSNVRLHGIGNFGDVTPLYIIDGVQGNINNLNPDDIESLQVLKDAGAYAIYGVRGGNGVIIITTKRGRIGRTKVSYDFYIGNQRPLKGLDLLNPQEMADLTWLALKNSGQVGTNGNPEDQYYGNGITPVLPDYLVAGPYVGQNATGSRVSPDLYNVDYNAGDIYQIVPANKAGTDWFHELYKPAISQNHTITASGGNDNNKYFFSLGYLNQQGTLLNTYLKKFTARINTSLTVNKRIRLGENLQMTSRENPQIARGEDPTGNEIFTTLTTQPILPVYDIKGNWASFRPDNISGNSIATRTMAKDDKSKSWEIFGNTWAEVDLMKNLQAKTQFGGTLTNYYIYKFNLFGYTPSNNLPNNSFNETSGYSTSWTWTNTLNFSKTFNEHSIKVLIGTEAIGNYNRETGGRGSGFYFNDPNYRFLSNGNPTSRNNYSFAGTSALYSFISRFDYGFKEKYFISATIRNDGSSVFGPENRFGWFPSVSAAWSMSEEKFLSNSTWLTQLKWRASFGKTGFYGNTDPLNQYTLYGGTVADAFYDIYGVSTGTIQRGFRLTRIGEPKTGWQEDQVINAGFESEWWDGKLSITADWYLKKSKGLLFPLTLPDIIGGGIPPNVNVGNVENTGVDLLLGSKGKITNHWNWDATFTLTTYKNKIIHLNDISYFDAPFSQGGVFVRNAVGQPIGSFYGYKITGLFQNTEEISKSAVQADAKPGRFKYQDTDGNDTIQDMDRVYFGNPNPKFTIGINIGINYKNVDFSTFWYGSFGNDVYNVTQIFTDIFPFPFRSDAKSKTSLYDSWTPLRPNAKAPIAENDINFSNIGAINSYGLDNGSYLRNKTMVLGYTFPQNWLKKIKIEKLRAYIQAVNLFTITKYRGLDPELSGFSAAYGLDFGNYPNNQKQYLVGLNVNF